VLRVGLTGGIACGKSRVRRRLAAAGFGTLDLDAVAHEMIAPGGPAYADVVAAFGAGILAADGTVDRKILGARVFADAAARAELNALVHPRVRDEERRRAAAHAADGGRVFVTDAALLVEAGLHLRFDRLVVVDCEGREQLRRLVERDGIDESAARARIDAQMPAADKRRFAHILVGASGSLEATDAAAAELAQGLADLAEHVPPPRVLREGAVVAALSAGPADGPRGLTPARWAVEVGAADGVELDRLKRALAPPAAGPWSLAAETLPPEARGPEALALVVGLWSLGRGGLDAEVTAAAMFSMAWLTDRNPERAAGAILIAIAAAQIAGGAESGDEARARWTETAERWAGATVPAFADGTVAAARRHPADPRAAGAEAGATGGDALLAAGLVAGARAQLSEVGASDDRAPLPLIEAARALVRAAARHDG
jgi:dephospho-CoA kinase